jgi:hypothetical protein
VSARARTDGRTVRSISRAVRSESLSAGQLRLQDAGFLDEVLDDMRRPTMDPSGLRHEPHPRGERSAIIRRVYRARPPTAWGGYSSAESSDTTGQALIADPQGHSEYRRTSDECR